ncbi:hypothetical protein M431DRAFT_246749 [Trichoderma harzianum CBS 226.95]|uniref:Uncharacterized protein n=1 Tax=Trichoderma harzianum CBS 226.95 TaxID=983964 RepID=A0A2T4A1C8_TRIHA|nr:hypothetical protein M431DRAFT_246749 [Trichoderma harzianum CBS 226.95]PTB50872.1 hypothetical protein M431DRAFT_246749 [Trichoderma harzianum CBS 226.95]
MNYWPDEFVVGRVHITSGKGRTGCSTDINTDVLGSEGGFPFSWTFEGSVKCIIVESDSILLQYVIVGIEAVSCPSLLLIASPCSRVYLRKLAACAVMWVERGPASNCRPAHSVIRPRECTATNPPGLTYEVRANGHKRHSLFAPHFAALLFDFFKLNKPTHS